MNFLNISPNVHIQYSFDLWRNNILLNKTEWMDIRIVFDRQKDKRLIQINKVRKCINIAAIVAFFIILCCLALCICNRIYPFDGILASIIMLILCSIAGFIIAEMVYFFFQAIMDKMEAPILLEVFQNSELFKRVQIFGFDIKRNNNICTPLICGIKLGDIKKTLEKEFQGIVISAY